MRVLLVMPYVPSLGFTNIYVLEPIPLLAVAAGIIDRHEVRILDLRIPGESLEKELEDFRPDVVGVTANIVEVYEAVDICRKVKSANPETTTIIGGHHVSFCPEDFHSDFIDLLVLGEGDITFPELMDALAEKSDLEKVKGIGFRKGNGFHFTEARPLVDDLDALPFLPRGLVDRYIPLYPVMPQFGAPSASILTSRGCTGKCHFCSIHRFNRGRFRCLSAERVVQDLKRIPYEYISIIDDNFFANAPRDYELCDRLREEGIAKKYIASARTDNIVKHKKLVRYWSEVGLLGVALGIEKISQEELDLCNKNNTVRNNELAIHVLKDLGIKVYAQLMVEPDWEEQDFEELLDYVKTMDIDMCEFTITTPLPGTKIYDELQNEIVVRNLELYDYMHSVTETKMPKEDFYKKYAELYRRSYVSKDKAFDSIFWRNISPDRVHEIIKQLKILTNYKTYLREKWWVKEEWEDR